eukprot:12300596-Ditylum_brightwellii.AAC.1
MVRAIGTTNDAMALWWGAYIPSPLRDSGNVARTNEWWGRLGTFVSVWRTQLVVRLILCEIAEFQRSHAASRLEMMVLTSSMKAMILLMRSLMESWGVTERWARSACWLLMFLWSLPRTSAANTLLRGHPWAKPLYCKNGVKEADKVRKL